ncbi:MAG: hypothetical protein ABL893_15780 [Hyphomicrobium sp.]
MKAEVGASLRSVRADWLRVQSEVAWLRMLFAAHAYKNALERQRKNNPNHDEAGLFLTPENAVPPKSGRDGSRNVQLAQARNRGSVSIRFGAQSFDATLSQVQAMSSARNLAEARIASVREADPNWKPTSSLSAVRNADEAIRDTLAIAAEAEARLMELARQGIGGNGGPPLGSAPPIGGSAGAPQPGTPIFSAPYRALLGMPTLSGPAANAKSDGTVAMAEIGGKFVYGLNSKSPGFEPEDYVSADAMRGVLIRDYPDTMTAQNIGRFPNDALYHAETKVLLRAAKQNGGTLSGKHLVVNVDRELCWRCDVVLPKVGLSLGNPTVTFIEPNGKRFTIKNGRWEN